VQEAMEDRGKGEQNRQRNKRLTSKRKWRTRGSGMRQRQKAIGTRSPVVGNWPVKNEDERHDWNKSTNKSTDNQAFAVGE